MIRAIIFDLDGTLAQTEKLKVLSYARAAIELSPKPLTEAEVIEAFKEFVGLSRQEVKEKTLNTDNADDADFHGSTKRAA
ncbi:MAG: HAD family hydrolase [bacterium]